MADKEEDTPKPHLNEDEAAQNKEVTTTPGSEATLMQRFLGALIDGLAMMVPVYILGYVPLIGSILGLVIVFAYLLVKDSLPQLDGQSIGKKVVGTRAVKASDNSPLTGDYETGMKRNAWLFIPFLEPVLLLLRHGKPQAGRRMGDDFAATKVITV